MPREKHEIKLFIAKDERSAALVKLLHIILETLPPKERPRVKLHVVKIDDVRKFPEFLAYLEEIYGGIHTFEFRRYNIMQLPAIVIDDQKVLEGEFPNEEQLRELLVSAGILLPPKIAAVPAQQPIQYPVTVESQIQEIPQFQPTPSIKKEIETQEMHPEPEQLKPTTIPSAVSTYFEKPAYTQPETEETPPKKPETLKSIQIKSEKQTPLYETRKVEHVKEASRPIIKQSKPPEDLRGTCFDCIFYDEKRGRCLRMSMQVPDPYNPPCGRRRK